MITFHAMLRSAPVLSQIAIHQLCSVPNGKPREMAWEHRNNLAKGGGFCVIYLGLYYEPHPLNQPGRETLRERKESTAGEEEKDGKSVLFLLLPPQQQGKPSGY